jgi:hypothetical protein
MNNTVSRFKFKLIITLLFSYGSGQQRIDDNKKCRQIAGNFDCHANVAVQRGVHRPMEHIQVSGLHWRYGASLGGPLCDAYNPTLGLFSRTCLHRMSDDNQTRPKHTTQRPNKHHHHGSGAATPQVVWIWWTHSAWGVGGLVHDFSKDTIKAI